MPQIHTIINAKKMSRNQLHCRHTKLIADESMRMLKCELCGLWINPFDHIMKQAQGKVILYWEIGELERKKKALFVEVESLKKEKNKAKRVLKNATAN